MQTRTISFIEVLLGTFLGFGVAVLANYTVLPRFGFQVNAIQSAEIALIFTFISLARGFLVRRFFNWLEKVWLH